MIKVLDKIIPTVCLFLSFIFILVAFYFSDIVIAKNISIKSVPDKHLKNEINRDFLKNRYWVYQNNATTTLAELKENNLRNSKIKILIVPGHDYEYGGAVFNKIKEADLTLKIGEKLKNILDQNQNFEVYITRHSDFIKLNTENPQDKNGYTDYFQKFLDENIMSVLYYRFFYKLENDKNFNENKIEPLKIVEHNVAPGEMLYRLYAINKWVEDNQIDIVIHLHLNDYPERKKNEKKYKGFSIYVPDKILKNGSASQEFANFIAEKLETQLKFSNNPIEKMGIIPGSELIALGANNTLSAVSILIEYGYIYEEQFINPSLQNETFDKMAVLTYLGIVDYFEK